MASLAISALQMAVRMCHQRFVYTLVETPDDRLAWSPGGDAPSPLQVAGKLAGFMQVLAYYTRTGEFPPRPSSPPPTPDSREAVAAALDAGYEALQSTLSGLSDEDLVRRVPAPTGTLVDAGVMVALIPTVLGYFQGQLNAVQMAYGDMRPNVPENWGSD